ncbi:MAG: HD domain-containing protein [Desulfovibrio sp.]|uniref:HD domain-containing protein n=1 Tax=Desulfovibrio sp. 7SRBS1 TaxID=3378064 RepID=UPI003B3EB2DC
MPSIRKSLLQLLFSGAYMKRWNDKLRAMELYEIDKQSHKMMVAWMLFELNSRKMSPEEKLALGNRIVEGGIFEYLYRLIITDIKPPVFYQIKAIPEHYERLTAWVLEQLMPIIQILGDDFCDRMRSFLSIPDHSDLAGRILFASHIYASQYEFSLIKDLNPSDEELEDIEQSFTSTLLEYDDIEGVPELLEYGSTLNRFAALCGRLRFQTRWSQTPRVPDTSVLGHMFIVASYAYFFGLEHGACRARLQNNFFSGIFHDLPEVLTRDIISPVKRSVSGIAGLIREYEEDALNRRVFSMLEKGRHGQLSDRLKFLLGIEGDEEEFATVIRKDGKLVEVTFEQMQEEYNSDEYDPKDGRMLKICDNLAAFIEAYTAVRNGISSDQLQQSLWRIRSAYLKEPYQHGVHIGALMADFD